MNFRFTAICLFFIIISFTTAAQTDTTKIPVYGDSIEYKVFDKVGIEASFPGGDFAWRRFLEQNLNASVGTDHGAPVGIYTVYVQFLVDKEGYITDVKALTNVGYGMEQEVIRLIKTGPQWKPASLDGRNVKAYRKQPVTFMIDTDEFEIISKEQFIFYAGVDNPISVTVNDLKPKDVEVTVSEGSIVSKGNGEYIVRVNKPGRVILQLYNTRKGNKNIGTASFQVRPQAQ